MGWLRADTVECRNAPARREVDEQATEDRIERRETRGNVEKLIYLLWGRDGRSPDGLRDNLLAACAPRLIGLGADQLSMNFNDSDAAVPAPVELPAGEQPLVAAVSLWLECLDDREPHQAVLEALGHPMAGYLVTESLYTDYGDNRHGERRSWADGERSPGVLTVTLLEKPERLRTDEWIAHWHGVQSPVSEEIQPRMRYVRNAVARAITEDAPSIRGIVDEAWPSAEHVRDPMLFYCADGSREKLKVNVARLLESVTAFLDMDRIRSFTMSEYLLKSRAPTSGGSPSSFRSGPALAHSSSD